MLNLIPAIWEAIAGTSDAYILRTWGAAVLRPYMTATTVRVQLLAGENSRQDVDATKTSAPKCVRYWPWPWHFLYFLPEPQGQGSLRPTLAAARTGFGGSA
jgi:hypothetical protein